MANDPNLSPSRKRTAGEADIDSTHSAKKRATRTMHHTLLHRQCISADGWIASQDHDAIRQMLERSLAMALEAVGFDVCEARALDSFRARVEEYMARFLRAVHLSMTNARRRQPVPHDFVYALSKHNLTLTSLLPHLDPPVVDPSKERHPVLNCKKDIMPLVELADEESNTFETSRELSLLDRILHGSQPETRPSNIPASFPPLPPRHTYKAQEVLPPRESDPQKVRERATEEGRLGEEALRRFTAKTAEIRATRAKETTSKQQEVTSFFQGADEMWKSLMEKMSHPLTNGDVHMTGQDGGFRSTADEPTTMLNGPVNAESRYWRKAPKRTTEKG